jgi:dihydroorotase-like cyclic amidohydrolase
MTSNPHTMYKAGISRLTRIAPAGGAVAPMDMPNAAVSVDSTGTACTQQ